MINIIQPFVDLTNANLQATSRFIQTPEMSELTQSNTDKFSKMAQESFMQMMQSDALKQWMGETTQNFSRFVSTYTQSVFQLIAQEPSLFARQMQDFSRQVEHGVGAASRSFERSAAEVEEKLEKGSRDESHLSKARTAQHRQAG
ncbi:MAG: hypothetical protein WAZ34_00060 [Rhodocyclaceae bacterium]